MAVSRSIRVAGCCKRSPSPRRARSPRPRQRSCRKRSAGVATGTTGIRGGKASFTVDAFWVAACLDQVDGCSSTWRRRRRLRSARRRPPDHVGVGGEHDLTESELLHLAGWRDSRPCASVTVRGTSAARRLRRAAQRGGPLPTSSSDLAPPQAFLVTWPTGRGPVEGTDQGIWEVRGARRLPLLEADVLGRARARDRAGRPPRRARSRRALEAVPNEIADAIITEGGATAPRPSPRRSTATTSTRPR